MINVGDKASLSYVLCLNNSCVYGVFQLSSSSVFIAVFDFDLYIKNGIKKNKMNYNCFTDLNVLILIWLKSFSYTNYVFPPHTKDTICIKISKLFLYVETVHFARLNIQKATNKTKMHFLFSMYLVERFFRLCRYKEGFYNVLIY